MKLKVDKKQKSLSPIFEEFFVAFNESSSVLTNDTNEPRKYQLYMK